MPHLAAPIHDEAPIIIAIMPSSTTSRTGTGIKSRSSIGYVLDPEASLALHDVLASLPLGGADRGRLTKVMVSPLPSDPGDRPEIDLSPRETAVLRALVSGSSYKMIGHELSISLETVRTHIKRIYTKLCVHNSAQAVSKAIRFGLTA